MNTMRLATRLGTAVALCLLGLPHPGSAAAPLLQSNQVFYVRVDSTSGTVVGDVQLAQTSNVARPLTFSWISGNTGGAFQVQVSSANEYAGQISVGNSNALTLTNWFDLQVAVTNADGADTNGLTIKVYTPARFLTPSFVTAENSTNGASIGQILVEYPAHYPYPTGSLVYEVDTNQTTDAHALQAFAVRLDGALLVRDGSLLDFETQLGYTLVVKVTNLDDPNTDLNFSFGTITIGLADVNEPPRFLDQAYALPSESTETLIGRCEAVDPEGDPLRFQILELRVNDVVTPNDFFIIANGNELRLRDSVAAGLRPPERSVLTIQATETNRSPAFTTNALATVVGTKSHSRFGIPLLVPVPGHDGAMRPGLPVQAVAALRSGEIYVAGMGPDKRAFLDIYPDGFDGEAARVPLEAGFVPTAVGAEVDRIYVAGMLNSRAVLFRYAPDGTLMKSAGFPSLFNITDMVVEDGKLYLCGSGDSLGWGQAWMRPYWAELDGENLSLSGGSPHYTDTGGLVWGVATAIAKEPGAANIYLAGYYKWTRYWSCNCKWYCFGGCCDTCSADVTTTFITRFVNGAATRTIGSAQDRCGGSFIKDLAISRTVGANYVYALEEFIVRDLFQAVWSTAKTSGGYSQDVAIRRFNFDLQVPSSGANFFITSAGDVRAESLVLSQGEEEAIYMSGVVPGGTETRFGSGPTAVPLSLRTGDRFFMIKLGLDLSLAQGWSTPLLLSELDYQPTGGIWLGYGNCGGVSYPPLAAGALGPRVPATMLVPYAVKQGVILAGNIGSGILTLSQSGNDNSVMAAPGRNAGFLTAVKRDKRFEEPMFLEVRSDFGLSEVHVRPHLGKGVAVPGRQYTVEVPPVLYLRGNGTYLGTLDSLPNEQQIENEAVTRYVCTGYTVEDTEIIGNSSSYTFVFETNMVVTFHWTTEHALEIRSDLTGTGSHTNAAGDYERDLANDLGLTSLASGNPSPEVKKHWILKDELVTAFVDGLVLDLASGYGTRYVVTGYVATGSAILNTNLPKPLSEINAFPAVQPRQQIAQFTLGGPASLTYLWGIQHRVQANTSSLESQDWPGIKVVGDSAQPDRTGSGEFWFRRGTHLIIGAQDVTNSLEGAMLATGDLTDRNLNKSELAQYSSNLFQITVQGSTRDYLGAHVTFLSRGTLVTWEYGNKKYPTTVHIGEAVDLLGAIGDINIVNNLNTNKGPAVRAHNVPPGATGSDMAEWDEVARRVYPVRPGEFFLHYERRNDTGIGATLIVTSRLDTVHYPHLAHPDMPRVRLDPKSDDDIAFLKLAHSDPPYNGGTVIDNEFSATGYSTNVLLFSRSDSNAAPFRAATGDRTKERLFVRVVGTAPWDKGPNGIDPENPPEPTTNWIGTKVTSPHDIAGLSTGFVIYTNARYNASIYDRRKVEDAGPIIPVNRHFRTSDITHDLVVVWSYRADAIVWPYRGERFDPQWPVPLPAATTPTNDWPDVETMSANGTNYLRRIVVASRLGSEGKDALLRSQMSFAAPRYEQVTIYHEPDTNSPGYNPNEEHALTAPSFKHLDQANPPPTAFALRKDYNRTSQDGDYTSDPFVLVQYLDHGTNGGAGEFKMAVYAIEKEDLRLDYNHPELPENTNDTRKFPYVFHYDMKAGEPVQPPYPLGLVIGLTPCKETDGENPPGQRVFWKDWKGQPWAVSAGDFLSFFWYPMLDTFWATNMTDVPGTCLEFPTPAGVKYTAVWPDVLPILKAGETLTFAGGEYKADNPDPSQPGLPGVVGWAAGEVLFDSMNPLLTNQQAFTNYTARLVAPLEERTVTLSEGQASELTDKIQPSTGLTRATGTRWQFTKLPASLGKRVYYEPISRRLGLKGLLNDKTLGDSTLTATPPPVYVLEPNILAPSEHTTLRNLVDLEVWRAKVDELYARSRNPAGLNNPATPGSDATAYFAGLEQNLKRDEFGNPVDAQGDPAYDPELQVQLGTDTVAPLRGLGPGLALVPSPAVLDPESGFNNGYVTLAENNDPNVGGPISLFIIKVSRDFRFRGAIKTILSDNVFDERITLRHSGDFGANADEIVYQWFYREEDGTETPVLPPFSPWRIFPDQRENANPTRGLGMYQIDLEGTGGLLLSDNLFFVRYRHKDDLPAGSANSQNWAGTDWDRYGRFNRDENNNPVEKVGTHWAGAANSPTVDGDYKPQLAMGWIKRVLDRVNPYEARISDFRNNGAPATYASMIQQFGQRYEGPVALNPDKNVIENVGLIELYETILSRARALSIDLSSPITTPGINTALQLAATRISDFYMLLGNEAYVDAQDPTIGFGSAHADYGSRASSMFAFQNQLGSLLDEELALLRGVPESYGRPVYNRLFWNFTKSIGEVAYAMNYDLSDQNRDGFVDESDAMVLFPQGHGDAWGHYLTALKTQYRLLQHPYYNWVSRAEQYNLLDVVINVDYLDERRFAEAAAARAKAGAEIVHLTYRSRYVEDPDGQWQGYTDLDTDRAWGVDGWVRRAGQGALFDWITANALIPSKDTNLQHNALQRIDRSTVTGIKVISAQLGAIQSCYDDANNGLNPLGLSGDVVPFDIDPNLNVLEFGVPAVTHFDQIAERADKALANALSVFDEANANKNRLRQVADSVDTFAQETLDKDRDYRNRLIEIFGTPYEGTIGPGKPYPAGYSGPDLMLYMYVDVADVNNETVPPPSQTFSTAFGGFRQQILENPASGWDRYESFKGTVSTFFINDLNLASTTDAELFDNNILTLTNLPVRARGYTFQADPAWGQRSSPGELQTLISELVRAEADLALSIGTYDSLIGQIKDTAALAAEKHGVAAQTLYWKWADIGTEIAYDAAMLIYALAAQTAKTQAEFVKTKGEAVAEASPKNMPSAMGGGDALAPVRSAALMGADLAGWAINMTGFNFDKLADSVNNTKQIELLISQQVMEKVTLKYDLKQLLTQLQQFLRNEPTTRIEVFKRLEALRQASDRYRATLQKGSRLLEERQAFNRRAAGVTQKARYEDMAFRILRNEAIQKYRASFDLAARYTYMSAKAYDYDTNLGEDDPGSAQGILTDILRARTLGGPEGLTPALQRLRENFAVLKTQMGLNNYQTEEGRLSLRRELFRIPESADHDALWRQTVKRYRVDDLWMLPEFRRYCRPPAPRSAGPLPGLVIPFGTEIIFGENVFGWPLGPGDHAYDPSLYATKIKSVGVWFKNYKTANLAASPRVYLVPTGVDIMTIPTSLDLKTREWNIVDQCIPVPHQLSATDLANPNWIPAVDSLSEPLAQIRRFSSFRAYGDTGSVDDAQLTPNTRLFGRSVWNTRWLLIIPGGTLLADADDGLDTFIDGATVPGNPDARDLDGVDDILLFFHTYGYSGN